ncbi:MAG: sn-glycerol-3-phosphate ABC transporter ATP-binding protein UgpC [Acidobacteria bacterium]|nr:sn-glycerol-3-phosphate ABC transporter ATP-binding protein UgpC [Acidobacteriota bacterium]MBI3424052.1 sn-glycerol-3-phosphate ABC transporter ATP-binding protein UgpC [Acidobacteriota bacterium]
MASLSLRDVSKSYAGGVRAVSSVNAEIADGEFIILVGPSGCGKSTLLRMIAGLEEISAGAVLIDGRVVNDVHAKDRDIAMVFQHYALYPHMSVAANMGFGLKLRKVAPSEIDRRVQEAAAILGLTEYLQRKPKALSGGQRQRVAVGRAIVRQPKLFLFDEPLSNLDAKMRVGMRAELIRLHKRLGATMVYVTHDQVEAMSMGDRLIVLKDGVVQQIGAPLEIYNQPANQFVAGFIGSPPMNFIHCEIEQRGADWFVVSDGLNLQLPESQRASLAAAFTNGERKAVLGIRPEDIHERTGAGAAVSARVDILEPLGGEVLATCSFGSHEIVARLSPRTRAQTDAALELRFDLERVKLFDAQTGKAVG